MTRAVVAIEPILDQPTARLCAAIADGERSGVRLAVVAPGEYGKTALLDHLESACAKGGVPTVRFEQISGVEDIEPALMLVDDAHALDDGALDKLRRCAEDDRLGLIVAARPMPRPVALNDVLALLRGQIVLRPLDRGQIEDNIGTNRTEWARFIHARTGGVPGLVHRVVSRLDLRRLAGAPAIPEPALADLRHELDQLNPDTLRLLIATDAGAGGDFDLLCGALGMTSDVVFGLLDDVRTTGLVSADGTPLPVVGQALRSLIPAERRAAVCQRLATIQLDRGAPVLELVRPWLGTGVTGSGIAGAFRAAAEEALDTDPLLAVRLFDAAVTAGAPAAALGARRAEAIALTGDLDTALRLADDVIASPDATDRADAARIAGTALAHRGSWGHATELLRWSGSVRSRAFAAVGLVATGRHAEAKRLLDDSEQRGVDGPPTLLSGALSSMARGVLDSVTGTPTTALSTLVSSAEMLEPVGRAVLLPDSPAALAAVLALQCGEPAIAEPLLKRAVRDGTGGKPMLVRHQLLLAWIAMTRGDTSTAAKPLAAVGQPAHPRDWLFAVAIEVGLARRQSDLAALRKIWGKACAAVIRQPVDLFTFLPLAEFAVAAARLGDQDRLAPHLARAHELLGQLGDPPLWSTVLHWNELHAALTSERRDEAERHAAALRANAEHGAHLATMSAAADCWLRALDGAVDPDEVEVVARGLRDAGCGWDGAWLARQAAIHTTDRSAMLRLLDCARSLQGGPARGDGASEDGSAVAQLSEREVQVARLVVDGLTYKEVGARLFISAKTVEHHIARIRQRLGADSRAELLTQLRALLSAQSAE
ncbi:helix-turn-helix transcriptional regulator [Haloechinothrix salitolerans]|uniref:LuxR C-terminal-related transcriptional regulator n=1 Tax=Haloechinothrix salitolerans TaxID=926830 RepID=A0ABW2BTV4_9PSEU